MYLYLSSYIVSGTLTYDRKMASVKGNRCALFMSYFFVESGLSVGNAGNRTQIINTLEDNVRCGK